MSVVSSPAVEFERPLDYRHEITARADRVRLLFARRRRYLMIDGQALPGSQGFSDAIGTLYPVAYTLHFALKRLGIEAPVGALEGLYWVDQARPITPETFRASLDERNPWSWRLLLPVPDAAGDEDIRAAVHDATARRHPPLIDQLRCEMWEEGPVAQLMHVGPYEAEPDTIERLQRAITEAGLRLHGCHHEIYISDPNHTRPERMKTLLRQPVEP